MNWLENRSDNTEVFLDGALGAARQRTGDEVARRRVWARIEDLPLRQALPVRRGRSFALPALTGALVAVGVVAVLWLVPATRPGHSPDSANQAGSGLATASQTEPVVIRTGPSDQSATPVVTGPGQKARVALNGAAVELDANSVLSFDLEHRPLVERGHARFAVPHQAPGTHFAVSAGPYIVTVVGTKFHVGVTDDRVSVDVEEGVVEVSRGARSVRLEKGDSWAGPVRGLGSSAVDHRSSPASLRPASLVGRASSSSAADKSPASVAADRSPASVELREARAELGQGHSEEALAILTRCAKGTGPAAENAAYEMGRVLRDRLHRPREAIAAWAQYRARFPGGLLRAETDLSLLETLASLGEKSRALTEADAFLARYPNSERRAEVAKLAARLRGAAGGR
ncbi:MAG TPA: FecR domain-containing protein [Polyangia bacterium]